jgi:hypothetical protein
MMDRGEKSMLPSELFGSIPPDYSEASLRVVRRGAEKIPLLWRGAATAAGWCFLPSRFLPSAVTLSRLSRLPLSATSLQNQPLSINN